MLDQGGLCVHNDSPTPPCSGLVAYRELTEAGIDVVRIVERDSVLGGSWRRGPARCSRAECYDTRSISESDLRSEPVINVRLDS